MNKKLLRVSVFAVALAIVFGSGAIYATKAFSDEVSSREGIYPYDSGYGDLGGMS